MPLFSKCQQHAGFGFSTGAGCAQVWINSVRVVRAKGDIRDLSPAGSSFAHQLVIEMVHIRALKQPFADPALIAYHKCPQTSLMEQGQGFGSALDKFKIGYKAGIAVPVDSQRVVTVKKYGRLQPGLVRCFDTGILHTRALLAGCSRCRHIVMRSPCEMALTRLDCSRCLQRCDACM